MNISILPEYLNIYDESLSINHLFLLKPDSFLKKFDCLCVESLDI